MDQNPDIFIKEGDKRIKCSYCALIITTTQIDIDEVKSLFVKSFKPMIYQGRIFERGIISNKLFVVVYSGTGMINMAITVQLGIDKFKPHNIIGIGIGGSSIPNPENDQNRYHSYGDIVIPKRWADISYLKFIPTDKDKNCYRDGLINYPNQFVNISDGYCTTYHNTVLDDTIGVNDDGKIVDDQVLSLRSGVLMKTEQFKTEIDDDVNQITILQENNLWLTVSNDLLDLVDQLIQGRSNKSVNVGSPHIDNDCGATPEGVACNMGGKAPHDIEQNINKSNVMICPRSVTDEENEIKIVSIGLSSHYYINNQNYDSRLKVDFNYNVIDTSSFALVTTASSAGIPSLVIKGIGYHLGLNPGDKGYLDIEEIIPVISENCIYLLDRLISILPDPDDFNSNEQEEVDTLTSTNLIKNNSQGSNVVKNSFESKYKLDRQSETNSQRGKISNKNNFSHGEYNQDRIEHMNNKRNTKESDNKYDLLNIKQKSSRRRKLRGFYDEESVQYTESLN